MHVHPYMSVPVTAGLAQPPDTRGSLECMRVACGLLQGGKQCRHGSRGSPLIFQQRLAGP